MENFYTYLWLREDGTPYYVGKGKGRRGYRSEAHGVHKPEIKERILIQEFESEKDAFEAEKFFIAFYGRKDLSEGCLRNLTSGGDGPSGAKVSEETRKKMSSARKGILKSEEHRRKIGEAHKGKIISEITRKKISKTKLGTSLSEEHRIKIGEANKGSARTEETKLRMSIAARKRWENCREKKL